MTPYKQAPPSRGGSRSGAAMALAAMTSVQAGLALSAAQFDRLGPVAAAWLRLVWAGLILLVLARPRRADFTRAGLRACLALGVVTAGMMSLFMLAVARIPLGTASALEYLGPLAVSLYGGRRAGLLQWSVLAGAGVLLLTEPWHGGTDLVGIALALGAGACWAGYIVLTQHAGDQVEGLKGLAVSLPTAALVTTVLAGPSAIGGLTPSLVLVGLLLAALAPLLPFCLELLALRRLTTGAFGTLMSLEPAIATAIGVVLLGQVPGSAGLVGVACVVTAGVAVVRTGGRAPAEALRTPAAAEEPTTPVPVHQAG
ncbi:DMT family transporter [Kitasatospora sp. RG8]|uniref:EamA family transporter n=1 Tax=Kitasatospora sp. RG8 TaxID=2820815 RepID=UPI001FD73A4E|nr:EamA family transporter [Kitasatospora sp. RG8]